MQSVVVHEFSVDMNTAENDTLELDTDGTVSICFDAEDASGEMTHVSVKFERPIAFRVWREVAKSADLINPSGVLCVVHGDRWSDSASDSARSVAADQAESWLFSHLRLNFLEGSCYDVIAERWEAQEG